MELFWIICGVFVLYARIWCGKNRHYYIIDDNVRRWDYLYVVPESSPPPTWYATKPHPWRHFFLVLTHCLNVWVVDLLFGWQVALLFAFHPISVNGTAWITGGYYAVTAFLTLTGFYFITTFPNIFGGIVSSLFFTAALGSTITCIGFPFIFLFMGSGWGLMWLWPLATYLFGKRFRTGFKIRDMGKKDHFTWRKPALMTKVIAYYIHNVLFPNKLAFFKEFGFKYNREDKYKLWMDSYNKDFWVALLLCVVFLGAGWLISPLGTLIFFFGIAPFSQYKLLGQFVAERYLYLPNVGICLILGTLIQGYPILLTILATAYAYRSHLYIPAFQNIENLYKNGIKNFPNCVSNYANLGERWLHVGEYLKAYRILEEGLILDPESFLCHTNLAAYWITVKNYERAKYHTELAIKYDGTRGFAEKILSGQMKTLTTAIEHNSKIKWEIDDDEKVADEKGVVDEKDKITLGEHAPREEVLAG
jgi:tetratricopeptide (TPR) repeat protein